MRFGRRPTFESLERRSLFAVVHWPTDVATESGRWIVPLEIDSAAGVRAAEIRLKYDAAAFSITPRDITAGAVWAGRGSLLARVDDTNGEIAVFIFTAEELKDAAGGLVDLAFLSRSAEANSAPEINVEKIRLNEGQIEATFAVPLLETPPTTALIVDVAIAEEMPAETVPMGPLPASSPPTGPASVSPETTTAAVDVALTAADDWLLSLCWQMTKPRRNTSFAADAA